MGSKESIWAERALVIMSLVMIIAAVNADAIEDKITCAIIGMYFLVGREALAAFRIKPRE